MLFAELGDALRRERERRGLSVEAVAGRLKLMPRVVRAIEQGEAAALPEAVYARGFVKAYGKLLELDAEQVAAALNEVRPDDGEYVAFSGYGQEDEGTEGGPRRFLRWALVLLVPVVLGAGVFRYWHDSDSGVPRIAETAAPDETPPAPEPGVRPPAALPTDREAGPPPEEKREEAAAQAAPAPLPDVRPAPETSGFIADAGRESAALRGAPHTIIITALAECWVHSDADGTDTRQFSLRKGDTFVLPFNEKLVLKLGNAGGVRIRFNGRDLPPPGESGQVKTFVFPPAS
jgi:cytoskeleton protein RodZ